jgi:hypothetical protein
VVGGSTQGCGRHAPAHPSTSDQHQHQHHQHLCCTPQGSPGPLRQAPHRSIPCAQAPTAGQGSCSASAATQLESCCGAYKCGLTCNSCWPVERTASAARKCAARQAASPAATHGKHYGPIQTKHKTHMHSHQLVLRVTGCQPASQPGNRPGSAARWDSKHLLQPSTDGLQQYVCPYPPPPHTHTYTTRPAHIQISPHAASPPALAHTIGVAHSAGSYAWVGHSGESLPAWLSCDPGVGSSCGRSHTPPLPPE